jgi:hypothetical protein
MEPEEELHGWEFLGRGNPERFQLAKPLLVFRGKACKRQFPLKERKASRVKNHSLMV